MDPQQLTLVINAAPALFEPTLLTLRPPLFSPTTVPAVGFFANYDLLGQLNQTQPVLAGQFEFGLFHPLYADNQFVGRTNAAGYALLPRLRSYESNRIRLETADLPLDTQIDTVELDAVPSYRAGVFLPFPVRLARGALMRLMMVDGQPVPVGTVVRILG